MGLGTHSLWPFKIEKSTTLTGIEHDVDKLMPGRSIPALMRLIQNLVKRRHLESIFLCL